MVFLNVKLDFRNKETLEVLVQVHEVDITEVQMPKQEMENIYLVTLYMF